MLLDKQITLFFLSGKTYYQVLWTPSGADPYDILARAYIAASRNIYNEAPTTPEVLAAMAWAKAYFESNSPGMLVKVKTSADKALREAVLKNASLLDSYNNGLTGPGTACRSNPAAAVHKT